MRGAVHRAYAHPAVTEDLRKVYSAIGKGVDRIQLANGFVMQIAPNCLIDAVDRL